MEIAPAGYWEPIRSICDARGVLLIFDEIPLGLGRTGRMFACEHDGVVPDMLVLGKVLGGAVFPMAALLARPELDVASHTSLGHFTHEKSPMGAAAAPATLDVVRDEDLVRTSREMGEYLVRGLQQMCERFPRIGAVRSLGLLVGVEIGPARGDVALSAEHFAERVMLACLAGGLSFKVSGGNVLTLTPPLTVTHEELDRALGILGAAVASISSSEVNTFVGRASPTRRSPTLIETLALCPSDD